MPLANGVKDNEILVPLQYLDRFLLFNVVNEIMLNDIQFKNEKHSCLSASLISFTRHIFGAEV